MNARMMSSKSEWLRFLALCVALFLAGPGPNDARSQEAPIPMTVKPSGPAAAGAMGKVATELQKGQGTVRSVEASTIVEQLVASLAEGQAAAVSELRKAGLDDAVNSILKVDDLQLQGIEAEELLKEIYRRGEAAVPGQGERILTYLYQRQAKRFPAVAVDPAFQPLREIAGKTGARLLTPEIFRFSEGVDVSSIKLPAHLEVAVRELSSVYAGGNLSDLVRLSTKAFGKGGFNLNKFLARSKTTREALTLAIAEHMPPPEAAKVMEDLMLETMARSPALAEDRKFLEAMEGARQALGVDRIESSLLRNYVAKENTLPSRVMQLKEANALRLPGQVQKTPGAESQIFSELLKNPEKATNSSPAPDPKLAQHYSDYLGNSFEGMDTGGGGGGGGGGRKTYKVSPPSRAPVATGSIPSAKVKPSFKISIRSARAARGIACGADLKVPEQSHIENAAWLSNAEDDRFGKIVLWVKVPGRAAPSIVATRTLFADSFRAATDVLWGGHYGVTSMKDGNILVLMSMDPFSEADPIKAYQLRAKAADFEKKGNQLLEEMESKGKGHPEPETLLDEMTRTETETEASKLMGLWEELEILQEKLPRRIVIHPSLHGRELAWSVARVDFWFNQMKQLSDEAKIMNGGTAIPANYMSINIGQADTWQFYERENLIQLENLDQPAGQIVVKSGEPADPSARGHFAISMFSIGRDKAGEEEKSLPLLEKQLQPLLDWLAVNHHDFIRVNDFPRACPCYGG